MAGDDRHKMCAEISVEAFAGWRSATRVYGGTVTTLAEVIGLALSELDGPGPKLPKHWRVLFAEAAMLEEARRKNQGRRGRS